MKNGDQSNQNHHEFIKMMEYLFYFSVELAATSSFCTQKPFEKNCSQFTRHNHVDLHSKCGRTHLCNRLPSSIPGFKTVADPQMTTGGKTEQFAFTS